MVTVVTWLHMRHPPALPKRLVEWMVCLLLVLSGTSLLVSGWNASHPSPWCPMTRWPWPYPSGPRLRPRAALTTKSPPGGPAGF